MKSFLAVTSKRTLASFGTVNGGGMSSCLSRTNPSTAERTQEGTLQNSSKIQPFSQLSSSQQSRNYSVMTGRGSYSLLNSNSKWMSHEKSSSPTFTQTLRFLSDKKKEEEELPPPIPGDDGQDEDFDFEDPNEAKHADEDLDGDREDFTVPIVINMPDMNDDNLISKIEKWYKEPGDIIKRNDILCDITTPDFTFGMVTEDDFDAIMGEHHVKEGESAEDNAPICTIYHQPEPEADEN